VPGAKKSKPKPKRVATIVAAALALGAAAVLLLPRGPRVGFYDVDPALAASAEKAIGAWAKAGGLPVRFRKASLADLGDKSLGGLDAVFLYPSRVNLRRAGAFADADPSLAASASLPLRKSLEAEGRAWLLPLLADTKELDWRKDLFSAGARPAGFRVGGLDQGARALVKKVESPIVASGGDDGELLDLAGLLVIERGGLAAYGKLVDAAGIAQDAFDRDLGGFSLRAAVEPLIRYRKDGLIHPNWLDFKDADVIAFVEGGLAGLSLQSLSIRRRVEHEAVTAWGSAVVAQGGGGGAGLPAVTASLLSIAIPKGGGSERRAARLAAYLVSNEGQRALQAATGLAPVAASVQAADIQAREARAAASGAEIAQGLSRDAFASAQERGKFAATLRNYLRANSR
jgi:ABC-type glycerol-3-phosphate transport system substrate-binding protein